MPYRSTFSPALACSLALLAAACGGPDDPTEPSSTTSGTETPTPEPETPLELVWQACNLHTEGPQDPAECAEVEVPLQWSDPEGQAITLFVKRLPAAGARRGALLLLDGGPGGGGVGLESLARAIADRDDGLDIYIPHHRGTGRSTKLACAGEDPASEGGFEIVEGEWPACIEELTQQWGAGLAEFSTTAAARDLGALVGAIEAERPGEQVFVLGSSYGTYLANRYLQLFPEQPAAVILDSICPPDGCHLDQFDVLYDDVGADFLALCAADATCSSHLGQDPRGRLAALYTAMDAGHCPELAAMGLDRRLLRTILAVMLNDWNLRLGLPALIRRAERCEAADVAAIEHLVGLFAVDPADPSAFYEAWSFPLQNNIVFSELWTDPAPAAEEIVAAAEATLIAQGVSIQEADLFPIWPRYARDELFGQWAAVGVPMLMMNGDLDPATPIHVAEPAGAEYTGPGQTFVRMPRSPHGALTGSPIDPSGETCGMALLTAFLADPAAPLDTSCKDQVLPVNFAGAPWLAQALFGTGDLYD